MGHGVGRTDLEHDVTDSSDRRSQPRGRCTARILWSVVGRHDLQIDRLSDVSTSGALVSTEAVAKVGEEIRFDLLDEDGEKITTGLARVVRVVARGMGIAFLALGVDIALIAQLSAQTTSSAPAPRRPPALPGTVGGPPPMPGEHLLATASASTSVAPDEAVEADEDDELAPQIEPLNVRRAGMIIGIDLGTTNTCASTSRGSRSSDASSSIACAANAC